MQSLLVSALRSLVLSLLATITIVTVSPPILFHGLLDRGKLQLGFGIVRDGNASIVAKNIETKLSAIIPPPNILPGITPGQCETPSLTDSLTTSSLPPDIQVHWQRKVTVKIQEASESKQSNST
ncbi:hypothetical protein BDY19DRAFT_599251 [Irpex rosettiformis]|uniref:Uncharacterized protein n=1 Tax=Irpex rosettiformis TaxID=378272 RepID=A0ACB8UDJ6_9APHY|nr:hypothetical protein BDY19DRAFT_599251 [Irpex rosettiformis]